MLVQALTRSPCPCPCYSLGDCRRTNPVSARCLSLNVEKKRFGRSCCPKMLLPATRKLDFPVFGLSGAMGMGLLRGKDRGKVLSVSEGHSSNVNMEKKRKVVEHICLLKAKEDISDEEEKDMLDYLYTCQYQMPGILTISLGRLSDQTVEKYTHAVFIRFQRKDYVAKFYENPYYLGVLKDYVTPHCHGFLDVDYETEVEDDILPIFRKGEEFNYGLEFILLISFVDNVSGPSVEDAFASLENLTREFPSLIVQLTQGLNFNDSNKEFTHGVLIRFRSLDAFEIFLGSSEYKNIWTSKFKPIIKNTLHVHFSVDPVGTELM